MNDKTMTYEPGKVTICIINYKTELPTRLCLRSIRKYTRFPHEVVVVDNGSNDSSVEYLRSVPWITLIERPEGEAKSGSYAHGSGLDIGLKSAKTEYFLSLHSDTFVRKEGWLQELVQYMIDDPELVCLGSEKLDLKPKWQVILKKCTDVKDWIRRMKEGSEYRKPYARSICSLYKTEILHKENLLFTMKVAEGVTAAKQLYYELVEQNYKTKLISPFKMAEYVHHLTHATGALNAEELSAREKTKIKFKRTFDRVMNSPEIQAVIHDDALDK